jgi:hypothetical protein
LYKVDDCLDALLTGGAALMPDLDSEAQAKFPTVMKWSTNFSSSGPKS